MLHSYVTTVLAATATQSSVSPGVTFVAVVVGYLIGGFALRGMLSKAGLPSWGGFVPFYGAYLLVKIAGYNGWLFLLLVVPLVNIVFGIAVAVRVGKAFGKGGLFSVVLLWLISLIGYLVCSYDSSTYRHPETGAPTAA